MNHRERVLAIMNYQDVDRLPVVHFGYWTETLLLWASEGHVTQEEALGWGDGNEIDVVLNQRLGWDFDWGSSLGWHAGLEPPIEERVIEELPDGSQKLLNGDGAIVLKKPGVTSIPMEFDHTLKGRREWEEIFKPRLQFVPERVSEASVFVGGRRLPFGSGGADWLKAHDRQTAYGLYCGSLYGRIRGWLGLVNASYLQVDDEPLFDEIIDTVGELCYQGVKAVLDVYDGFDFGHFWEDICFKSGPLINPRVFAKKVGPHYKRITDLLNEHGIHIVSLDCDGKIDALVPIWLENGVNTMFPIEVGTWGASIAPWRAALGPELRGVGGMDKKAFARDRAAVDAEIERLRPLVDLSGYIPCPDHRIAPDAQWDNVRYYCDRMHQIFG